MPAQGTYGAASVRAWRSGSLPQVAFRNSDVSNNSSMAAMPAGTAVGDIVIVVEYLAGGSTSLTTLNGVAWNRIAGVGDVTAIYWKIMTATDLANPWNFNIGGMYSISFVWQPNGASAVSVPSKLVQTGSTTLSLAGTTSAGCRGIASFYDDPGGVVTGVTPAGLTSRFSGGVGGGTQKMADNAGGPYSGGAVIWTGLTAAHTTTGLLFKFT